MKVGCLLQPGFTTQGQCEIKLCSVPEVSFATEAVQLCWASEGATLKYFLMKYMVPWGTEWKEKI